MSTIDEIMGMVQAYGTECAKHEEGPDDLSHQIAMSEHRILSAIDASLDSARKETIRDEIVRSGFDSYSAGDRLKTVTPERIWLDAIKWAGLCWALKESK